MGVTFCQEDPIGLTLYGRPALRYVDVRHLTGHTSNKDALYVECLCKSEHTDDGILTLEDWVLEHAGPKKYKKLNESQELAHCLRVVQVREADGSLVRCAATGWTDRLSHSRGACAPIRVPPTSSL